MYATDPLARRSPPLQQTTHSDPPQVRMHPETAAELGLADGEQVRVRQGDGEVMLDLRHDDRIAAHAVWLPASMPQSAMLGGSYDGLDVEAVRG